MRIFACGRVALRPLISCSGRNKFTLERRLSPSRSPPRAAPFLPPVPPWALVAVASSYPTGTFSRVGPWFHQPLDISPRRKFHEDGGAFVQTKSRCVSG